MGLTTTPIGGGGVTGSGSMTGGGVVATGGFTLTVPATGTAALLGTANVFTAAQTLSVNGAASTPPAILTGTIFTGGSATTTKPQLLIEPTGTTSTGWSTSGTGLGVNAASGFAGNLLDVQVAGSSKAKVSSGGTFWSLSSGAGYLLKRNDTSDPNTGLYSASTTHLGIVANNTAMLYFYGAGTINTQVFASTVDTYFALSPSPHVNASGDVRFYRDAANVLAHRNDTNAQTFRLYGTYTDASNYVRLGLNTSSTTLTIAAETAGTGADDIDLAFTPAGTGTMKFGTHSAVAAETVTGYITIKDSGGTTRKLAVIS